MNFGNTKLILGKGGSAIGSPLDSHIILYTDNREQFRFTDDGKLKIGLKGSFITTYQDSHLIFHTNKFERLRINDQGRVGIGTKNQKAVLQITKTNNINTEESMFRVNFNESWGLKLSQHNDGNSTVVITDTGKIDSLTEFSITATNTGGHIWIYNGTNLLAKLTILAQPANQIDNYIWIAGASVDRNVFRWSDINDLEYQGAYLKDCIEAAGGTWPTGWSYQSNWYDYDNVHTSPPGDGEISWYVRTTDQTKTVNYNTYSPGNVRYELNQRANDVNYGVLHIKDGDVAIATINEGGSLRKGKVGIGIRAPVVALHMEHTDAIKIPKGTTAERPTANAAVHKGYVRYNTTLDIFEGYGAGPAWGSLGGVIDVDQDTYIVAESSAGADNDELWFYTAGKERLQIKNDGKVGIGTDNPDSKLELNGNMILGYFLKIGSSWDLVTVTGTKPNARRNAVSVMYNNEFIIHGGNDANTTYNDVWKLNLLNNEWNQVTTNGETSPTKTGHIAIAYVKKMFIFGGEDNDVYNLNLFTNTWTKAPVTGTKPNKRYYCSGVLHNTKIYIFGGWYGQTYYNDLWEFDIAENSWELITTSGSSPSIRNGHKAEVYNGEMYVFGGYYSSNRYNDLYKYNFSTKTWSQLSPTGAIPGIRNGSTINVYGNELIIFGGRNNSNNNLSDVYSYNFIDNKWIRRIASSNINRYWTSEIFYDGAIYIFGGINELDNLENTVYKLSIKEDTSNIPSDGLIIDGNLGIGTAQPTTTLTLKRKTDNFTYGSGTQMIDFKPYMYDETNNIPYDEEVIKASIYSGIDNVTYGLNTTRGYLGFMVRGSVTENPATNPILREVMRIDNQGYVGIGTVNPLHKLHIANLEINNTIQDLICLETQTSSEAGHPAVPGIAQGILFKNKWHTNSTKYSMARISAHSQPGYGGQLAFWTNNGANSPDDTLIERLRINEDGNVGIGINTPYARLDIENDGVAQEVLKLYQRNAESYGANSEAVPSNSSYSPYNPKGTLINLNSVGSSAQTNASLINFNAYGPNGGNTGVYLGNVSSGDNNGPGNLVFGRRTGATSWSESMRINKSGYVGIGTNNYVDTRSILHIKKNSGISFQADTGQTDSRNWRIRQDDYGAWGSLQISVGSNNTDFGDSSSDVVMTMLKNRNVGIGTTNPDRKVHIVGDVRIEGSLTTNGETTIINTNQNNTERLSVTNDGTGPAIIANQKGSQPIVDFQDDGTSVFYIEDGGNVGIGTTDPYAKLHVTNGTGDIWTTTTTVEDCHVLIGGYEWGGTSSNETLKIGLGYFDRATANVPMYIGCRVITSPNDTTSALVFGTRNSEYDTTAAEERLCILPNGNVGIGTTSPGSLLQVGTDDGPTVSDGTIRIAKSAGNNSTRRWGHLGYDSSYNFGWGDQSSTDKQFKIAYAAPTNSLVIDSNGNMSVSGTGSFTGTNNAINTSTTVGVHLGVHAGLYGHLQIVSSTDNGGWIDFIKSDSGNTDYRGRIRYGPTTGNSEEGMIFYTDGSERLRIKNNGNVGIGTSSPQYKLDIRDSGSVCKVNIYASSNGGEAQIRLSPNNNSSTDPLLYLGAGPVGSEKCVYISSRYDYPLLFLQDNSEKMRIDDNGNVGIGTTNPGEKLSVNGSIMIKGSSNSTTTNESKLIFTRDLADSDESEYIAQIYTGNYSGPLILEAARGGGYIKTISNRGTTDPIFVVSHADGYERFRINGYGYCTLKPFNNSGINNTWIDSLSNNNKLFFGDANFGIGAGKFGLDMGSNSNSECTVIWCYAGPGRGIRFCSTSDGDGHKVSQMTTRMIVHGDTGNVGIGTTNPLNKLHTENIRIGDWNGSGNGFRFWQNADADLQIDYMSGSNIHKTMMIMDYDGGGIRIPNGNIGIGTSSFGKLDIKHPNWTQTPSSSTMCDMLNLMVSSPSTTGENNMRTLLCFADGYRNDSATKDSYRVRCRMSGAGFDMIWNSSATETIGSNTSNNNFIFARDYTAFMNKKVGIGTTSPNSKLHISDSGDTVLKIVSTNATSPGIELVRTSLNHPNHHNSSTFADDAWTDWKIYNNGSKLEFQAGYRTATSGNHLSTSPQTLVTAMSISQDGNVGIGTTSPLTHLDIQGVNNGGNCLSLRNGNNNNGTPGNSQILFSYLGSPYTSGYTHKIETRHQSGTTAHENSIDFYLWKNGQSAGDIGNTHGMSITAGGVGIGTTSPRCPLNTNKLVTSSDNTIPNYVGDIDGNNTCDLFLGKSKSSANNYWGIWMGTVWNSSWGYPSYIQAGSTSTHYPLLLNPNGGNVGIGTTSPGAKLQVNGNILFGDGATAGYTQSSSFYIGLSSNNNAVGVDGFTGMRLESHSTGGNYSQDLKFYTHHYGGGTGGTPRMTIRYDGKVGIGTIDPGNFKLKIYNNTGTNTNGSNLWHNHFCVEETTAAGAGMTFKAGTQTGYIYYGSNLSNPWIGTGSFGFATTATGNSTDVKMIITNDGKVGINNRLSTTATLDIWGPTNNPTTATMSTTSSQAVVRISGAQGQCVEIGGMGSANKYGVWMQTHNQSSTSNTQYSRNLCIQPIEGNVGIGTLSPFTKLHIRNNTDTTGTGDAFIPNLSGNPSNRKPAECLRLQGSYNDNGSGALIRFTNYHASGSNPSNDEYNLAGIAGYDHDSNWGGGLCFYTAPTATAGGGNLTARMNITPNGNVGIGTTSPNYGLSLGMSEKAFALYENNGNYFYGMKVANVNGWGINFYTSSGNDADGNIRMSIKRDSGYVGVGTTSPNGKLHTVGSSGVHALRVTGNCANSAQVYCTESNYGIRVISAASSGSYYSAYFTGSSGNGMYVRDDGDVGIGTSSPSSRLHVKDTTCILTLETTQGDANGRYCYIDFKDSGGTFAWFGDGSGGNKLMYMYLTDNQPFVITGSTVSSTRVGIGNTNPGYMLDVTGDINFTGTLRQNGSVFSGGISFPYNAGSISGTAIIGKIRVGSWNYGSYDYMSIQHHSLGWANVTGNYALRQDATGITDINCATGKSIGFLCNNEYKMYMNSSGQFSINNSSNVYSDAKISVNVPSEGTFLCSPDVSQYIWRINHSQKWGIYWATEGSGNLHYLTTDSNPNEIVFVGNGTARASVDLDNGFIYSSGVKIGTNSSSSYQLHIEKGSQSSGTDNRETLIYLKSWMNDFEAGYGGTIIRMDSEDANAGNGGCKGEFCMLNDYYYDNLSSNNTSSSERTGQFRFRLSNTNGDLTDIAAFCSYRGLDLNPTNRYPYDNGGSPKSIVWGWGQSYAYYIQPVYLTETTLYASNSYTRLQLMWHTGVHIGAHPNYGGISFWDNYNRTGAANKIAAIGDNGTTWFKQNITCTGDITAFGTVSDITLKRNIVSLNTKDILNKVLKIRPVKFKWVDDLENELRRGKQDEGLIAQEVEKIWPMLVGETDSLKKGKNDKIKYIHYNKLSVYLAGAIQEQQKEINQLKEDKEIQKKEITELRNENNMLKEQMKSILERLTALESK